MNESALLNRIRLEVTKHGTVLFRNQTGTYKLQDGRYISSGLCVGSSDLIGWTSIVVTPEMVGRRLAVFTAIEAKSPEAKGKQKEPSADQIKFLEAVNFAGGMALSTNNLDECVVRLLALR